MTVPAPGPRRRWLLLVLLGLWTLHFAETVLVPGSGLADEEAASPTSAALLAAGHPWMLAQLQYQTFCGGCTVETLLALVPFWLLGPRILVWKLIPLLVGWGLVIASWFALEHTSDEPEEGRRRASIGAVLLVFGPAAVLANATIAFGSHFEVTAGILGVLLLWAHWLREGSRRNSLLLGACLGLLFWFSYGSAFLGPTLLSIALVRPDLGALRDRVQAIAWTAPGVALGLLPWVATQLSLDTFGDGDLVYGRSGADLIGGSGELAARLGYLDIDLLGRSALSLMPHTLIGPVWLVAALACATVALGVAARGLRRLQPLQIALPAVLLAWVAQFLLFAPLNVVPVGVLSANPMRYLVPGLVLLVLVSSLGFSYLLSVRPGGLGLPLAGALLLFSPGAAAWLGDMDFQSFSTRALSASVTEDWMGFPGQGGGGLDEILHGPGVDLSRAARHRHARWIAARAHGAAVTNAWLESGTCDGWNRVVVHIADLPRGERDAWIQGIAVAAPPRWLSPRFWEPQERLVPDRSCPGVLVLDEGVHLELVSERLSHEGPLLWEILAALEGGDSTPATRWLRMRGETSSERLARRAMARALGRAAGETSRREGWPRGDAPCIRLLSTLPAELRSDYARGVGLGLGRWWGHRRNADRVRLLPWPEELRVELRRGMEIAHDRWYVR